MGLVSLMMDWGRCERKSVGSSHGPNHSFAKPEMTVNFGSGMGVYMCSIRDLYQLDSSTMTASGAIPYFLSRERW